VRMPGSGSSMHRRSRSSSSKGQLWSSLQIEEPRFGRRGSTLSKKEFMQRLRVEGKRFSPRIREGKLGVRAKCVAPICHLCDEHLSASADANTKARRLSIPIVDARLALQRANAEVAKSDRWHVLGTFWVPKSFALWCITMKPFKQGNQRKIRTTLLLASPMRRLNGISHAMSPNVFYLGNRCSIRLSYGTFGILSTLQ
jgi:hypothetical protein